MGTGALASGAVSPDLWRRSDEADPLFPLSSGLRGVGIPAGTSALQAKTAHIKRRASQLLTGRTRLRTM